MDASGCRSSWASAPESSPSIATRARCDSSRRCSSASICDCRLAGHIGPDHDGASVGPLQRIDGQRVPLVPAAALLVVLHLEAPALPVQHPPDARQRPPGVRIALPRRLAAGHQEVLTDPRPSEFVDRRRAHEPPPRVVDLEHVSRGRREPRPGPGATPAASGRDAAPAASAARPRPCRGWAAPSAAGTPGAPARCRRVTRRGTDPAPGPRSRWPR